MPRTPLRIGITGADGFLGWHLRAFLHGEGGLIVIPATRATFQDPDALMRFASSVDAIAHLAGMNRGSDDDIRQVNRGLAEALVRACDRTGVAPHIVFANSTHHTRAGAYGESKRAAAEHLAGWAQRTGAGLTNLILPHLFGEHGRPFYNSAVATFCHQLAGGETPRIPEDGEVELFHAQATASEITRSIRERATADIRPHGRKMRISAALARLTELLSQYRGSRLPSITDDFDHDLFNTARAYLFPAHYPLEPAERETALRETVATAQDGHCLTITTVPGATFGNRYHRRTFSRVLVLRGKALVRVRRLLKDEVHEFVVSGDTPALIDMPTLHAHNIANVGHGDLEMLLWTRGPESDTYEEQV